MKPQEGDWFSVPLKGGAALCLLARHKGGNEKISFGYFFKASASNDLLKITRSMTPKDAFLSCRFGNDFIRSGKWPYICTTDAWDRELWPLPCFLRKDIVSGQYMLIKYCDDGALEEVSSEPISVVDENKYPRDGMYGALAVINILSQ